MTALIASAGPEQDARLRPLPWRRMTWVIWRQHRIALSGVAALAGVLALWLSILGPELHHAYAAASACHPTGSIACEELVSSFNDMGHFLASGYVLQAVPALIGAFVGAPILARELETGTFRYAWTQGFGPWRWTLAKLVALAVVVVAAAGILSVLFSWYYRPYLAAGNQQLSLTEAPPLAPGLFDLRGVALAAWTLAAFAIGGLAGVLIRRVVPAILATLAAYAALALAAGGFLRRHYLTPLLTSRPSVPGSAWIVSQRWTTKGGQSVGQSRLVHVLQGAPPELAGKGGIPKSVSTTEYLMQHGFTQWTGYQPAGRFWTFQWIEGGWLLALSTLLIATTVWLVRRRGGPKRRERPRLGRAVAIAGAVLALGMALAGCGGGASTASVASVSNTTKSSSAGAKAQATGLLAYASCMRSHGVPSFPDPTSGGGSSKEAAVKAFKEVSDSQVQAAQTACQHLQPNGGEPSRAEVAQHIGDLLAFARCMRTHGITNFPDPTSRGEVTHEMLAGAGIDLHEPAVVQSADACTSVTHGALTKAAVARFVAGR
jgi:hypothetical protein